MDTRNTNQEVVFQEGGHPPIPAFTSWSDEGVRILDGGIDTLYFSFDLMVSPTVYDRLMDEQELAREARDERRAAYVSDWLNAEVAPHGANGYALLIQRADRWAIRVQMVNPHQPGIFVEMRSMLLHTHPEGVLGACLEVCDFIREHLTHDDQAKQAHITLKDAKCSRLDLHLDWQGGWHPTIDDGEIEQFLKPGHTSGDKYFEGNTCLGYSFGKRRIMARIYDKTQQMKRKQQEWYLPYLQTKAGDAFNPDQHVYRLEFELKREGVNGFQLVIRPEASDPDEVIEAEMEGEDLPSIGNVLKAVHWGVHLFDYLTHRWLRLVMPTEDKNKARWPTHPTWQALQAGFAEVYHQRPLTDTQAQLVRTHRHSGYRRALYRMGIGVLATAQAMLDTDPASALPIFLEQVQRQATAAVKAKQVKALMRAQPQALRQKMEYWEHVQHLCEMALGVFTSAGVTKAHLPPFEQVGDLLEYLLDDLEAIAKEKGGIGQLLYDKYAKLYKVLPPQSRSRAFAT